VFVYGNIKKKQGNVGPVLDLHFLLYIFLITLGSLFIIQLLFYSLQVFRIN